MRTVVLLTGCSGRAIPFYILNLYSRVSFHVKSLYISESTDFLNRHNFEIALDYILHTFDHSLFFAQSKMFGRIAVPCILAVAGSIVQQVEGYTAPNIIFMIADGTSRMAASNHMRTRTQKKSILPQLPQGGYMNKGVENKKGGKRRHMLCFMCCAVP